MSSTSRWGMFRKNGFGTKRLRQDRPMSRLHQATGCAIVAVVGLIGAWLEAIFMPPQVTNLLLAEPISTGAAIAMAVAASVSAASNIYATKRAGKINQQSIEAQERAEREAAAIERERLKAEQAEAEARRKQEEAQRAAYYAFEQKRWDDYVRTQTPYWNVGQQAYGSLLDLAGGGLRGSQAPLPGPGPTGQQFVPAAPTPSMPPGGTPAAGARGTGKQQWSSLYDLARSRPRQTMAFPQSRAAFSVSDLASLYSQFGKAPSGLPPTIPARQG